eukprot:scaffold27046_cov75-Skeletonema_dohrnii-CCMP3373.AAC.1
MRILLNAAIAAAILPSVRVVVADDRHVSSLDSTHLFPGADFNVDIDAATHTSDASYNSKVFDRVYGKASIFPAFIRKMQQATGRIVNLPDGYSFHNVQVQTLYLTESSVRHIDARVEEKGDYNIEMTPLEDSDESLTAFYVQESTADAYFETDDDELCIPYVEGSAIYFNGGLPHHSIVKSGAVKLVGPFLLSTLESVGKAPSPTPRPTKAGKEPKTSKPTPSSTKRKLRSDGASESDKSLKGKIAFKELVALLLYMPQLSKPADWSCSPAATIRCFWVANQSKS